MNEENIIDANEGLNEFDDNPNGPFLIGIFWAVVILIPPSNN